MSSRPRSAGGNARRLQQAVLPGNARRAPGQAVRSVRNDGQSSVAGEEDPDAALEFLHAPPATPSPAPTRPTGQKLVESGL